MKNAIRRKEDWRLALAVAHADYQRDAIKVAYRLNYWKSSVTSRDHAPGEHEASTADYGESAGKKP